MHSNNKFYVNKGGNKLATKLTQIKNPLTEKGGSIFDPGLWLGGILWVIMFGMIVAMGTKALSVIDSKLPGSQTYQQPAAPGSGLTYL